MISFHKIGTFLILQFCFAGIYVPAQQTEEQRVALEREQRAQEVLMRRRDDALGNQTPPREVPRPLYPVRKTFETTVYLPLYLAVGVPLLPEELAKITPSKEDFETHKDFLKKSNRGLAKIFPDPKCSSEFVIDLANPQCAEALSMPGRGAYFSFRVERNFPFPYADIHFDDRNFKAGGKSELGIIADLGEVDIENLDLFSREIAFARAFKPAKTEAEIRAQEVQVNQGFAEKGFIYSSKAAAKVNHTYVVRTVAFRHNEQFFNDKRVDILVVFRVLKQDSDGAVTFIWRRLEKDGSPRITK